LLKGITEGDEHIIPGKERLAIYNQNLSNAIIMDDEKNGRVSGTVSGVQGVVIPMQTSKPDPVLHGLKVVDVSKALQNLGNPSQYSMTSLSAKIASKSITQFEALRDFTGAVTANNTRKEEITMQGDELFDIAYLIRRESAKKIRASVGRKHKFEDAACKRARNKFLNAQKERIEAVDNAFDDLFKSL